jgi:hypothetical protein
MKKLLCSIIIVAFLITTFGCATNRTMQGGALGAGAGTIVSVIAGKSGSTAALWILGGALLGGIVGNTMDEQAKSVSMEPQNRGKIVIAEEHHANNGSTNCHKVTKRSWKDGNMVSETTEEVCNGNRKTNTY